LPSGFQKIYHYGWMSPNCRVKLAEVTYEATVSLSDRALAYFDSG